MNQLLSILEVCVFVIASAFSLETYFREYTGGPTTADHVDILGATELNDALLSIASGNEHEVKDRFVSRIQEYARKIRW
jgi:hypothetical protein